MACDCPSLTERCPHCGRVAGQDHKDRCHEAAAGGADVGAWTAAEARRMGVIPPVKRGRCSRCRYSQRLRKDGTVQAHYLYSGKQRYDDPCGGSGLMPWVRGESEG